MLPISDEWPVYVRVFLRSGIGRSLSVVAWGSIQFQRHLRAGRPRSTLKIATSPFSRFLSLEYRSLGGESGVSDKSFEIPSPFFFPIWKPKLPEGANKWNVFLPLLSLSKSLLWQFRAPKSLTAIFRVRKCQIGRAAFSNCHTCCVARLSPSPLKLIRVASIDEFPI